MTFGLVPVMEVNYPPLTFFPPSSHILLFCFHLVFFVFTLQCCLSCLAYTPSFHLLTFLIYTSEFLFLVSSDLVAFFFSFFGMISARHLSLSRFSCLSNLPLSPPSPCLSPSVLPFHLADSGRSGAKDEGGRHRDQRSSEFPHRPGCRCQKPQGALIKNSPQLLVVSPPLLPPPAHSCTRYH